MEINTEPKQIYQEYQTSRDLKNSINLYRNVELNQKFINGDQWGTVVAPLIDKPVINILKPARNYYISNLVSDDIAVSSQFEGKPLDETGIPEQDEIIKQQKEAMKSVFNFIANTAIKDVIRNTRFKQESREFLSDCATNGDAWFHWFYNTDINTKSEHIGAIDLELIDNTNIHFGNSSQSKVQRQPYIIISKRMLVSDVQAQYPSKKDEIFPDDAESMIGSIQEAERAYMYVTVLCKFYKKKVTDSNGDTVENVHYVECTNSTMLRDEVNLGTNLYPIEGMVWQKVKNIYHGVSPFTEVRSNQVSINKFYMMFQEMTKRNTFIKYIYNQDFFVDGFSNKTEAIALSGSPMPVSDMFSAIVPPQTNVGQFLQYATDLIEKTNKAMGIYDIGLGNAKMDTTSAIIQLQKSASQPLELQRLNYYQVVENCARIIVDIMSAKYGVRDIPFEITSPDGSVRKGKIPFNFADLDFEEFNMKVDIGSASYWSEITQIRTLDNMLQNQLVDAMTYIELLPQGVVVGREIIKEAMRAKIAVLNKQAEMIQQQGVGANGTSQMQRMPQ